MRIQMKMRMLVVVVLAGTLLYANAATDSTVVEPKLTLDVKDTDIQDVIRMISKGYGINVVLDKDVSGTVTVHLSSVPVMEGLRTLAQSNGLVVELDGSVYRIRKPSSEGRLSIRYYSGYLTADIMDANVLDVIKELSSVSGVSIVPQQELNGKISGKLYQVAFDDGIRALMEGNGFKVLKKRNIYRISKDGDDGAALSPHRMMSRAPRGDNVYVEYENGLLSLNISNGNLAEVLDAIAERCEIAIVTYGQITDMVNARFEDVPLNDAFALLLGGTMYTFVQKDNIFLVGDRNTATPAGQALTKSELVHLKHIKADEVVKTLPKNIPPANVQVIKEQNALLISGTSEDIGMAREFLATIDIPSPQVVIDAIVVEYSRDLDRDFGLELGFKEGEKVSERYSYPYTEGLVKGDHLKNTFSDMFPQSQILKWLPDDFFVTLRLMEKQGRARVLAQPSITVLNGNEAKIQVGQTQYYRIVAGTSENPTYRFESIEFGINLTITPWISLGGQITTVITPEISNPMGFNKEGYPNVFRRSVSTTVRLENGQTIALGGLLRSDDQQSENKVPILGDIPIIGYLFKTSHKIRQQTNLVIYITPRIIDGNNSVNLTNALKQFDIREKEGFDKDFYGSPKPRRFFLKSRRNRDISGQKPVQQTDSTAAPLKVAQQSQVPAAPVNAADSSITVTPVEPASAVAKEEQAQPQ